MTDKFDGIWRVSEITHQTSKVDASGLTATLLPLRHIETMIWLIEFSYTKTSITIKDFRINLPWQQFRPPRMEPEFPADSRTPRGLLSRCRF